MGGKFIYGTLGNKSSTILSIAKNDTNLIIYLLIVLCKNISCKPDL